MSVGNGLHNGLHNGISNGTPGSESTPICRCRVLWLGSAVPQASKDGLQGAQEPLRELYPEQGAAGARGLDSWLSVWSNGILLENVDENHKKVTRFFPIESLHYCAAVRYVLVPEKNTLHSPTPRFLPLDSPFARAPNPLHPPLFAAILRRTTGIKVLECHAFICKREMAANALVRCCFHAYADSSYARHIETNNTGNNSHSAGGSIYGTLGSRNNLQKVDHDEWKNSNTKMDGWKLSRSNAGSTMTINSVGKNDDVSIYNGDENHKVWAGSQDNLDSVYDIYSASTISRPSRPRQIAQPVEVPPPPPKEKGKKRNKKLLGGSKDELYPLMNGKTPSKNDLTMSRNPGKASSIAGGTLLKPRPMGTLMRPGPVGPMGHHQMQHQPVYIMSHPAHGPMPIQTLPNPKFFKHGNTFSHRHKKMLVPARPVPPPFVPVAPMMIPNVQTMQKSKKKGKKDHHIHSMEEPIYIPNNRAMSPIAGYQPVNFPHEAYMMQHYATMESQKHAGTKKKEKQNGGLPLTKANKKLAQSMNGLDDPNLAVEESPFNTGIYRKKGHLNERAFSYSIRQEHRSRSYGSLANLKFATPIPNGVEMEDREDMKKEREIIQMVRDLDLNGEEIERGDSRGMYEHPPGPGVTVASPGPSNSLHRPRSHMQLATVMTNGRPRR